MAIDDTLPKIETYRGVGIHAFQPRDRIEAVVKPAIDAVFATANPDSLVAVLIDVQQPPEARLLAAARCEALWELAAANREVRPKISLTLIHAHATSLDSLRWADPWRYTSLLEPGPGPGQTHPRRNERCAAELRAARAAT